MSLLERINEKLTAKNKAAAERPPNSELVLLLGHVEILQLKDFIRSCGKNGLTVISDGAEVKIGENSRFLEMLIIPVDFEEYLGIVRKI